jgi:plasmid stabilization system protein ParE
MLAEPIVTPEADANIREIDAWWRAHRPAAPDLFREELAQGFLTIRTLPHMGRSIRHPLVRGARRVVLRTSRYHV